MFFNHSKGCCFVLQIGSRMYDAEKILLVPAEEGEKRVREAVERTRACRSSGWIEDDVALLWCVCTSTA